MPRKKQGLRAYHHKSRKGCTLCKHRHVKCDTQQPACSNCVRRDEFCQYPADSTDSSLFSERATSNTFPSVSTSQGTLQDCNQGLALYQARPNFDEASITRTIETNLTSGLTTTTTLRSLLDRSWFSPAEIVLWTTAFSKTMNSYQHVGHCIFSVSYLQHDLQTDPKEGVGKLAYQHQVAASECFRKDIVTIDAQNWIPATTFHIFTLVFMFLTQSFCKQSEFDVIRTLHILKHGSTIESQVGPYFQRTVMWSHILRRTAILEQSDPVLQINMQMLGRIIAERHKACIGLGIHEEQILAVKEAHNSLCAWIVSCAEHPRRWDQYCAWPSCLTLGFFDTITDHNEIALLLLIYWCALMYRAPQPSVHLWAYRTAQYFLSKQPNRNIWQDLLSWPLDLLSKPRKIPRLGLVLGPT